MKQIEKKTTESLHDQIKDILQMAKILQEELQKKDIELTSSKKSLEDERKENKELTRKVQTLRNMINVNDDFESLCITQEIVDGIQWQEKTFFKEMLLDMREIYEYEKRHQDKIVCDPNIDTKPRINFIVPLRNREFNFHRLLNSIERVSRENSDCRVRVVVSLFASSTVNVSSLTAEWSERTGIPHLIVGLYLDGFSRALGLNKGIEPLPDDEIGCSMDSDMLLPMDFFSVLRRLVVKNRSVYAPICYSFNILQPREIRGDHNLKRVAFDGLPVDNVDANGYWRKWGAGMIAYYISDAKKAGAYVGDANKFTWGLEDIHFVEELRKEGLILHRKRHPGLYHLWHPKVQWDKSDDGLL